jgi:hypothetical protein
MSTFQEILDLARQQSAALARGDLEGAVRLLDARAPLVARAGAAGPGDDVLIHEILHRDRQLSSAIRERMIELRNRAAQAQTGRSALSGYRVAVDAPSRLVDARG